MRLRTSSSTSDIKRPWWTLVHQADWNLVSIPSKNNFGTCFSSTCYPPIAIASQDNTGTVLITGLFLGPDRRKKIRNVGAHIHRDLYPATGFVQPFDPEPGPFSQIRVCDEGCQASLQIVELEEHGC